MFSVPKSVHKLLYIFPAMCYSKTKGRDIMKYIERISIPTRDAEESFRLFSHSIKMESSAYTGSIYPFGVLCEKQRSSYSFEPITIFCGSNGSGKSTLLNVIAEKTGAERTAPFNETPLFADYLDFCEATYSRSDSLPLGSRIITSDDVFDYMLDIREKNQLIDERRERIFGDYRRYITEYDRGVDTRLHSLDDIEEYKCRNLARRSTKSAYAKQTLKERELPTMSIGESAFYYFTDRIKENALYLLDEPENSLSAKMQIQLAKFIEDSARFYGCQFIISTHSPFILAMRGAKIYDLDRTPCKEVKWTEIEACRTYFDFFLSHKDEF